MKKQSKKSKIIRGTCLFLLRLLYWGIEGWIFFFMHFYIVSLGDSEPEVDVSEWVTFIVLALAMTVLEVIRVHKRWNDETTNKRVLVIKSFVVVFLPMLLFYLIFIVRDILIYFGIYI